MLKEPRIDGRNIMHFLDAQSGQERITDKENPLRAGNTKLLPNSIQIGVGVLPISSETKATDFQRSKGLLQRFFKGATNGHGFAHAFHLGRQRRIGLREFLKSETWDFSDHVVDRRLEAGRSHPRDVILQFIQRVADSQLGCDFRNRKSRSLRGQGRTPRNTRIHFDHDHATVGGID